MRPTVLPVLLLLCVPLIANAENNYPTQARVEYVIDCMARQGGANFQTMYQCSCAIDQLAQELPYTAYVEADTYTRGRNAMGERGGILREGKRARERRAQLEEAVAQAERACFLEQSAARP